MTDENRWLPLFLDFCSKLRIDSKEVANIDGQGAPLDLWGSQQMFLEEMCGGLDRGVRSFYCLKARQLGISTVSLAIDVFWLAVHSGTIGALVTDTPKNSSAFRTVMRRYIKSFPTGFLGKSFRVVGDNRDRMEFSNGSRLDFLVAGTGKTKVWGEGIGYSFAHLTELASYGNPAALDSFEEALAQSHPDRLFIYESTAKGMNHWYERWLDAGKDTATKHRFFIGWWSNPLNTLSKKDQRFEIYGKAPPDAPEQELIEGVREQHKIRISQEQLAWRRWKDSKEGADAGMLQQNQPWLADDAFVQSGHSFFQTRSLQQDLSRVYGVEGAEPILYRGYRYSMGNDFFTVKLELIDDPERIDDVELRVWHEPVKGAKYVIGADPAFGRSEWKDRHAISVWRCYADRLVLCAEYAAHHIDTRQCAWVLAHLAGAYRDCVVNLELTGPGRAVMEEFDHKRAQMRAEMYEKAMASREWDDFLSTASWYLSHRPDSIGAGYMYNTEMNFRVKFEILNQLRDNYVTQLLDISSAPLLEEMMTVVQDGNDICAAGRGKDDRVFAAALANKAWIDWVRKVMIQNGQTFLVVTAEENGEPVTMGSIVDRRVAEFFRNAEEHADDEILSPETEYLRERGLA
jgi:hypothetical protein